MTGALLDLERIVAADGHPGQAGAAQVVEAEALARRVVAEERRALDLSRFEVLSKIGGPPLLQPHRDHRPGAVRLGVHGAQQWEEGRLNRKAADAFVAGLGLLDLPGVAIPRDADCNDAALDVDVAPVERLQLTRANEQVRR